MKHARMLAALICAALLATSVAGFPGRAEAAGRKAAPAATQAPSKGSSYRQFTGTVVALDASSLTVEKGGRAPRQMVFARHAGMRSTGEVQKDARVTVYWRDEGGHPVAHRVVVKPATSAATP